MSAFDVIFLSYDEPNAEEHWQRLLLFFPQAKRVSGVKGIYNALMRCVDIAEHERFYLVDADSWIVDGFQFRRPRPDLPDLFLTWAARNAVNDLVHPNGGIKLLSKKIVRSMKPDVVDETYSMEADKKYFPDVASENRFNSSPFLAWRGAFRECAKSAARIFNESTARLNGELATWQDKRLDRPHANWAVLGARQGARYGVGNSHSKESLLKINDFDWLRERFALLEAEIARTGRVHAARVLLEHAGNHSDAGARQLAAAPASSHGARELRPMAASAWPPPHFLYLAINQRCNLRCQHCNFWTLNDDDRDRYLSRDRRSEILSEFAELSPHGTVVTTGGESMLDLEEYFYMSRQCRTLGLTNRAVINGTRVRTTELAERMIREGPHEIAVSLNSQREDLHDRTRGVDGAFRKAVGALRLLLEARALHPGSSTQIYVSGFVFEENYRELDGFYDFVLNEVGADKLSLNCLQPSFGSHPDGDEFFARQHDVDPEILGGILDGCDEKYGLSLNPVWISQVKMYFRSVRANKNAHRGWNAGRTAEHICNTYERNIMVDLYGMARLCFSAQFPGARLVNRGDLTTFWTSADPIRNAMKKCNAYCGIASCARRENATFTGRVRD